MAETKGAPRSKRGGANNGPSRQKYWANKTLEKHKVKNLMNATGMTRAEALVFWLAARGGRRMRSSIAKASFMELPGPRQRKGK